MELQEYAAKLDFQEDNGIYYKLERGFVIYLRKWKYTIYAIPSFYIVTNKEITEVERKRLEVAAKKNACALHGISEKDTLIVTLPIEKRNSPDFKAICDEILDRVTALLINDGYEGNHTCFFCKQECTEYTALGEEYIPMHKNCFQSYYDKFMEKYNKHIETRNKRFILSICLAILGALIGIVPSILTMVFMNDYITFLGVFVPLFMTATLFLSKPDVNKVLPWIFLSISFITFAVFLSIAIPSMIKDYQSPLDFFFGSGWVGFRKLIFSVVFVCAPLGLIRFYKNLLPDYELTKNLLEQQKVNNKLIND